MKNPIRNIALIAVALIVGGLALASYEQASVGELSRYVHTAANSRSQCKDPAVVASLEGSVARGESWHLVEYSAIGRAFDDENLHRDTVSKSRLSNLLRALWLFIIGDKSEIAAAYCAVGGPGHGYELPDIALMVDVRRFPPASARELQALTDVYVLDLRWRVPPEKVRAMYQARLAAGR